MKFSKKIAVTAFALSGFAIGLLTLQNATAGAGKGYREIYYSDASKTREVGFMMNRIGCGGTISIFGTKTQYLTRNSFICA